MDESNALVSFRHVTKTYDGETLVVRDLNLDGKGLVGGAVVAKDRRAAATFRSPASASTFALVAAVAWYAHRGLRPEDFLQKRSLDPLSRANCGRSQRVGKAFPTQKKAIEKSFSLEVGKVQLS